MASLKPTGHRVLKALRLLMDRFVSNEIPCRLSSYEDEESRYVFSKVTFLPAPLWDNIEGESSTCNCFSLRLEDSWTETAPPYDQIFFTHRIQYREESDFRVDDSRARMDFESSGKICFTTRTGLVIPEDF